MIPPCAFSIGTATSTVGVVDKPKLLQTTIPFHKGWSVLVDGKLISPFISNGGLLAFNLAKGEKQIVLEFKPTDLKLGLIVTLISFIVCILILFKNIFK